MLQFNFNKQIKMFCYLKRFLQTAAGTIFQIIFTLFCLSVVFLSYNISFQVDAKEATLFIINITTYNHGISPLLKGGNKDNEWILNE